MARSNGKAEPESLDVEHELPAPGEETLAQEAAVDFDQLKAELEKVTTERDSYLDRLARLQAEFDNARKRSAREQQEYREYALAEAVKSLLPVLDSFDRALAAPPGDAGEFRAGLELINRQFHDALAKLGVRPIKAEGEPFDPQYHQAVQVVETAEAEDNHVLQELQRGYKLKERLLRPAMVRVARNPRKQ
jgi:molecular chaperone GrpE